MEQIWIIILGFSAIAIALFVYIDLVASAYLIKKLGKNSDLSIFLRSILHGCLLSPTFVPLGMLGFIGPVIIGVFFAREDQHLKWSAISFVVVFMISLIRLMSRRHFRKSQPNNKKKI